MTDQNNPNEAGAAMMPYLIDGLKRLNVDEMERLDAAITPDTAFLMTKAFGPELGALLWPLIAGDES
ncbi:MAG: hypothetical protein HN403_19115 [Rhodospirillales bacterium]|jgi:hypothetical protein|nr:hypothetical protein [Rhodospirillales bacterium]